MNASIGIFGGARPQHHLRQTFVFLNAHPLNRPEVIIPYANKRIDENSRFTDEKTREKIKELLEALATWTVRLQK
jgi:chromate reductase